MSNSKNTKIVYSFNAVTEDECIENFAKLFKDKTTKEDIISIHNDLKKHVSPIVPPLEYPLVIETTKFCFCLHCLEKNIEAKKAISKI